MWFSQLEPGEPTCTNTTRAETRAGRISTVLGEGKHRPYTGELIEYACDGPNREETDCHGPESLCSVAHCSFSCGSPVQRSCGHPQGAIRQLTDPSSPRLSHRTNRVHMLEGLCPCSQQRRPCGSLRVCERESDQDTASVLSQYWGRRVLPCCWFCKAGW
jgi:hypothetical protein